jgi:ABC-type multidrug transport system ATPase subunit
MDPYARRSTWEMLRKSKKGRVILLTTHFMDEAEILSDRIAVMKSGQLQCFGSPLFLKKAFGLGYTLTVVLSESPCNSDYTLGCGVENPANNLKQNGPDQAMNSTLTFSSEKKQRELKHHQCEEIQQNREVISTHGAEMVSRSSHYVSLTDGAPPGSKMERVDTSKITPNDLDSVSGLSVNMELETNGEQMLNRPMMKAAKSIEVSYGFSDGDDAPVASFLALQGISETDVKKTRVAISDHSTVVICSGHRCNSSVSSSGNVQSPDELELEKGLGGQFMLNQADLKINARTDILGLLQQFIPETQLLRYSGREVMFRIPNGKENMFPELFDFFDNAIKCCRIHIGGYGISSSSLEEIFLLLAEDSTFRPFTNEAQVNIKNPMLLTKAAFSEDETRSNFSVVSKSMMKDDWETVDVGFFGQLSVLLRKRFSIQRRDFKGFFSIILVPFLAISVVLLVLTVDLGSSGPPIQISLELYKNLPLAGENKTCSVLLGNGSSLLNNDATMLELKDFLQLNSHYVDAYEAHDVSSSKVMSSYLLNTTSSSTKAARLGSYVVGDRINVHVDMNWNQFWKLSEEANVMSYVNNTQWSSWLSSKPNGRSLSKLKIIEPYWKSQRFDSERFDPTALPVIAVLAKELLNNLQENGIEVLQLTNNLNPNGMSLTFPGTYHMIRNWPNGKAKYRLSVNTSVTILHNITSPHGVAIFNHEYANSRYKQCTGNGSINIVNHPLPISTKKSVEIRSMLSIFAVLSTLIPLCFVPSAIIVFAVKEKGCKSKHVQLVSGVRLSSYWISCYIWDLAIYSVLVALIMCVLALYGPNSAQVFMGDTASVFATALLFLGYGVSALPFAYLISRTYESSSDAQISVLCWFFITGFMALATYGILLTMGSTTHIAVALKPLFRFFPAFNVGDGLLNLCLSFFERQIFSTDSLPLDWSVAGGPTFFLFILSIPYMCLLLILECSETSGSGGNFGHILRKTRRLMNDGILKYSGVRQNSDGEIMFQDTEDVEDEDVTIMKNQVLTNIEVTKSSAKVLMINLWKIYPKWSSVFYKCLGGEIWCACFKRCGYETSRDRNYSISDVSKLAVRGLTLAIKKGETFGLLGANGAGKSTTMAILTGDTAASSGDAVSSPLPSNFFHFNTLCWFFTLW